MQIEPSKSILRSVGDILAMKSIFGPFTLTASVGKRCINKPVDVALVQDLLVQAGTQTPVDGVISDSLIDLIKSFQKLNGFLRPDGVVSPHGPTLDRLLNGAGKYYAGPDYLQSNPLSRWWNIASADFVNLFARQFPNNARLYNWTLACPPGLAAVFSEICRDPQVIDLRWAAYMMATCQRECPGFVPISEYGKGVGRPYGKPEDFKALNGKTYTNTYYGRGYVQLTWGRNYLTLGEAIGLGQALAIEPDDALKPGIAYKVMSYGMRNGSFTGRKLGDFIGGGHCDYFNARTIINGHNEAAGIANCAKQIEALIRLALCDEFGMTRRKFPTAIFV